MCNPAAAVGVVGIVVAAAGTVVSVQAQRQASNAAALLAERQSQDQAAQTLINLAISDREKDTLNAIFDERRRVLQEDAAKLVSTGRARFAAGNILLGAEGSALDWEADTEISLADDIAALEFNRERALFAADTGDLNLLSTSLMEIESRNVGAQNTRRAGRLGAAATGIQGASSVAGASSNLIFRSQGSGGG